MRGDLQRIVHGKKLVSAQLGGDDQFIIAQYLYHEDDEYHQEVRLLDLSGETVFSWEHGSQFDLPIYSAGHQWVVTRDETYTYIWRMSDGELVAKLPYYGLDYSNPAALIDERIQRLLQLKTSHSIEVIDLNSMQTEIIIESDIEIESYALNHDSTLLLVQSESQVAVWALA